MSSTIARIPPAVAPCRDTQSPRSVACVALLIKGGPIVAVAAASAPRGTTAASHLVVSR